MTQAQLNDKYVFTPEMREISGFGGGYETTCRAMVVKGLTWMDEHPQDVPVFMSYESVVGVIIPENPAATSLTEAMTKDFPDCTGAMVEATINHVIYIHKNGWDAYVKKMSEPKS